MIKTIAVSLITISTFQIFSSVNEFHTALPSPVQIPITAQIKEDPKLTATRLALIEAKAPQERLVTLTRSCYYAGLATNLDPVLIATIISPESEYKINAQSKKGYKSLMQTKEAIMKWEFAEANVMAGACDLRSKLIDSKGNMRLAMSRYKGGTSREARNIADKQLRIYFDIKHKVNQQMKG